MHLCDSRTAGWVDGAPVKLPLKLDAFLSEGGLIDVGETGMTRSDPKLLVLGDLLTPCSFVWSAVLCVLIE